MRAAQVAFGTGGHPVPDPGTSRRNLAELDRQLEELPEALRRLQVEGGWYAVLRIPAMQPDEETVLALLKQGVWVQPGYFLGCRSPGGWW